LHRPHRRLESRLRPGARGRRRRFRQTRPLPARQENRMTHDAYLAAYDRLEIPITVCCCLGLRVDRTCARGCSDAEWRAWFIENVTLDDGALRVAPASPEQLARTRSIILDVVREATS